MKSKFIGLDRFRLTPSSFARLGTTPVCVMIQQRGPGIDSLRPYAPAERLRIVSRALRDGLSIIRGRWTGESLTVRGRARLPWTLDGTTTARNVVALARLRVVADIFVESIQGRRKVASPRLPRLYSVRGLVGIQVEGQTSGYQTFEERIVLIRAQSPNDACRRLAKEWRAYASPGMNSAGGLFRWQLEEVMDVYELFDDQIDLDRGTEVYSRLERRLAKGRPSWNPRGAA
jgi:hypothetical protein